MATRLRLGLTMEIMSPRSGTVAGNASVPLENLTETERGVETEIGTGAKTVDTEMWTWIAKEIETGTGKGKGIEIGIVAMIEIDVVVSMIGTEDTGIVLDPFLVDDRMAYLDPDLVQDLRLVQEGNKVDLTWLRQVQPLLQELQYQVNCLEWHSLCLEYSQGCFLSEERSLEVFLECQLKQ